MTELLPDLPFTRTQRKRLAAAADIMSRRPDRIDFLHTVQCQCGIPYGNPGDHVREWERKQGLATLRMEAGSAYDPTTGEFVPVGLPYGEKPRLVLIHLASEAIRSGSPVIDVEDSMTAFARALGLATSGPHLRHLKDQLSRLAAATVRMGMVEDGRAVQVNTQIVSAFDLWYPAEPGQRVLWPSTVRLSAEYFASLERHAVPLDRRAVAPRAGPPAAVRRLGVRPRPVRAGVRPRPRLPPAVPRNPAAGAVGLPGVAAVRRRPGPHPRTESAAGGRPLRPITPGLTDVSRPESHGEGGRSREANRPRGW
jgi:hypothetical protein